MRKAPKSVRLHIGLFGRTNVGKSSFLNMVAGQDVAITSPVPGTTTDVVEKSMELLPVGPVVFLDTAGLDDVSVLSDLRIKKTKKVFDRADIIILVSEADAWGEFEDNVMREAASRQTPFIIAVNKADLKKPSKNFLDRLKGITPRVLVCNSTDVKGRDNYVHLLKQYIIEVCPQDFIQPPTLLGDIVPKGGTAVLIVPIDKEAPKGRIILPQVQVIRDGLDNGFTSVVVTEKDYLGGLAKLKRKPDIVICDSQVVDRMVSETPEDVPCTTFSIVLARNRGNLTEAARAARTLGELKPGDRILVAEACSHHPIEDDIGRIKLPKWLERNIGGKLEIETTAGRDFPDDLGRYKLIIHCGSCMINRREMLSRSEKAEAEKAPMTNYGVAIAYLQGVLERVLSPFPEALEAYRSAGTSSFQRAADSGQK